ncbi:PH domain-containing protein [bacterium]|nr:PH domain-containing protein [bacterium]
MAEGQSGDNWLHDEVLGAGPDLTKLDDRVINLWRVNSLIGSVVFLGLLFGGGVFVSLSVDGSFIWVACGWVTFAIFKLISSMVYPSLAWKHFGYLMTDKVLEIRSGVLWKVCQQVPMSRLQHVDLQRGPLERSFGLATLTIYTAGTQQAVLTIPGLEAELAAELRDQLVAIGGDDGV